ncbi:MAG: late competence development ComFB family protein [Anaerocolumna sp.]
MEKYHNVMETLVVNKLTELWDTLDCCKCDKCRNDIIACTLNQMEPKYVATEEGELYVRLCILSAEHEFEIVKAIATSVRIVSEHPKHYI